MSSAIEGLASNLVSAAAASASTALFDGAFQALRPDAGRRNHQNAVHSGQPFCDCPQVDVLYLFKIYGTLILFLDRKKE